jgi:putative transposase
MEGPAPSGPRRSVTTQTTSHPQRRHPAHHPPVERNRQPVIVQVNVCSKDRLELLAKDSIHELCRKVWQEALSWRVGTYVIMPDHIHLFCTPGEFPPPNLRGWVRFWKSLIAQRWPGGPRPVANDAGMDGTEPVPPAKIWQRDYWDTQMRSHQQYDEKLSYVRQNPVRKGMVTNADEWPYQGKVFDIRW